MRTITNKPMRGRVRRSLAAVVFASGLAVAGVVVLRGNSNERVTEFGAPAARTVDDAPGTDGLTDSQRRGRQIYNEGTSSSGGNITASLGPTADPVPASLVACVNCHGRDGRGRAEGGIDPADVTWAVLTRPRASDVRRARPAYTPATVGHAITMGRDPAGEPLGVGMPRYQLSMRDMTDLLEYLRAFDRESEPGVNAYEVRIGTILPPADAAPELREAIVGTLRACVADLNERGGVYQRRVALETAERPASRSWEGLETAVNAGGVFALVAPYVAGYEDEFARLVREECLPVFGPFAHGSLRSDDLDRTTFVIHPGPGTQARALAVVATREAPLAAPAVVVADDPVASGAAAEAAGEWEKAGGIAPARFVLRDDADGAALGRLAELLSARATDALLYLGPAELARPLLEAAGRADCRPRVYLPGALWDRRWDDLPPGFEGRVTVALPYLAADVSRAGRNALERLRARHGLAPGRDATRFAVLAAFKVFEEGLRRTGRPLTRAGLVDGVDRLFEFETGFSRPLTFGPRRRVGSSGAYIFTLDGSGRPPVWTGVGEAP